MDAVRTPARIQHQKLPDFKRQPVILTFQVIKSLRHVRPESNFSLLCIVNYELVFSEASRQPVYWMFGRRAPPSGGAAAEHFRI